MSAADFYKENTVNLICGWSPGGGFDYVSRTFASFWPDHGGGPMVVKTMTGGSGLTAQNYVYKAKPDGLTIGITNDAFLLPPVINNTPGVEYEINEFLYIGWFTGSPSHVLGISTKLPYTSMADLQKVKGIKFGSQLPDDTLTYGEAIVAEWFNLEDCTIITGWKGMADAALAAGKGEIDGVINNAASYREYVDRGWVKEPVITVDFQRDEAYYPNTPAIGELVELTPERKALLDAYISTRGSGKTFFTSPGVPKDRLEFLRDAFWKMYTEDKGAQKQLSLRFESLYPGLTGDETATKIRDKIGPMSQAQALFEPLINKYAK
ncbi:Bug family tripartite tricarboxylate transporter substrate binding protein [Chloroflexota bacterium]